MWMLTVRLTVMQVRELEVELAAQEAAFWEAEREAIAAEDAEEHMAAIEWRTKQAAAARARDAAAEAVEQVGGQWPARVLMKLEQF